MGTVRELFKRREKLVSEMREVLDRAYAQRRELTAQEDRRLDQIERELDSIEKQIQELQPTKVPEYCFAYPDDPVDPLMGTPPSGSGGRGLAGALRSAGFHPRRNPRVELQLRSVWPDPSTWSPKPPEAVLPLGRDWRYLYVYLTAADARENTAINDFRQTGRTVTGTIERPLGSTSEKARLDVQVQHVTESLRELALVLEDIPNAVLESPVFQDFVETELRARIEEALDEHVVAQIDAANVLESATPATTHLLEKVRRGIALMRSYGAEPTLLVLNPEDAVEFDLLTQPGTQDYLFAGRDGQVGTVPPLWGLRVVEHRQANRPPMLVDPNVLGVLYRGVLRLQADPYTGFSRNVTRLRVEMTALMHVRARWGACKIVDQA